MKVTKEKNIHVKTGDKKKRIPWTKTIGLLFMLICVLVNICPIPCRAVDENATTTTLKVAFYPLDGFFEYDEKGNECGYGVDFLNELSKYENIKWEYVPVDSWEEIGDMVASGEVDVRMPVSAPTQPSDKYDYTVEPVMATYHAIMTLDSRTDLYYNDYETFSKMKVAVTQSLLTKTGVTSYLTSVGVSNNLVYYDDIGPIINIIVRPIPLLEREII